MMIGIFSLIIFAGLVSSEDINTQCSYENDAMVFSGVHLTSNDNLRLDCYVRSAHLKFKNSSLLYIPSSIFIWVQYLQNLDVSNSGIIDLSENSFREAVQLVQLNVSGNSIEKIRAFAFSGAKKLGNIDLSYNRISEMQEHCFDGLRLLHTVDMTGNQLTILRAGLFVDNISLLVLKFRGNQIATMEPNIFGKLEEPLAEVDLSENRLGYVNISQNVQVHSIDLSNNQIQNYTLNCDKLDILNISHNNLTDLKNAICFENVRELDLSYNHIPKISTSTLASLKNLKKLILKHNNFTGLRYGTFPKRLESLDLSDNNLQTLNLDILYLYHSLHELNLSGNNFSEFSGKYNFSSFFALRKLDLRRNNFNCSYLFQLVAPIGTLFDHFDYENNDHRLNIHGIECHHDAETFSDTTEKHEDSEMTKFPEEQKMQNYLKKLEHLAQYYNNSYNVGKHHMEQMDQLKILPKLFILLLFITIIVILAFGIIIYRLILSKRLSLVNTSVSYRSSNTIQSNIDLLQ